MKIEKYTFGIGGRFAHEGRAQLQAILKARVVGIDVHPVWNKSNGEHLIIKSSPNDARRGGLCGGDVELDGRLLRRCRPYRLENGGCIHSGQRFLTLDVADFTGKSAEMNDVETFLKEEFSGPELAK